MRQADKHTIGPFVGRLLLSFIFIISGLGKVFGYSTAVMHLKTVVANGAETYITIALFLEIVGGLLLLLGWYTQIGVYLLMLFLLTTTFVMHAFWNYSGSEMMMQAANFFKNLAVFGGLLYVHCFGPGGWSLDALRARRSKTR